MVTALPVADVPFAIVASPHFRQDGVAFCARASGLYRTVDGGRTWTPTLSSLKLSEPVPTLCLAFAPSFSGTGTVFAGTPGAVLRSVDAGESWKVLPLPFRLAMVSALAVSSNFEEDGVVLAGTVEDGVFRSGNRGEHWAAWNFGLLDLNILCLARSPQYAQDETLLAGVDSGIFRSTNGGRAWREVAFPLEAAPVISLALAPNYGETGIIFAGTEASGLWVSRDDGEAWQPVGAGQLAGPINTLVLAPDFPKRPHILALAGTALRLSRDGGHTWTDWNTRAVGEYRCVAAGEGLHTGAALLVGMDTGMARI